jgi:hypothetical protein
VQFLLHVRCTLGGIPLKVPYRVLLYGWFATSPIPALGNFAKSICPFFPLRRSKVLGSAGPLFDDILPIGYVNVLTFCTSVRSTLPPSIGVHVQPRIFMTRRVFIDAPEKSICRTFAGVALQTFCYHDGTSVYRRSGICQTQVFINTTRLVFFNTHQRKQIPSINQWRIKLPPLRRSCTGSSQVRAGKEVPLGGLYPQRASCRRGVRLEMANAVPTLSGPYGWYLVLVGSF